MGTEMKRVCLRLAILLFVCSLHTSVAGDLALCNITNCMKGSCNEAPGDNLLDLMPRCECDPGWSQPVVGIPLSFLPCVIPNCTLNSSCSKAAPPFAPPPNVVPPTNSSCALPVCGEGGSCEQKSILSYVCNCEEGYENILNMTSAPCVKACLFGLECSQLGISLGRSGSASPPNQQVDNNKGSSIPPSVNTSGVAKDISSRIAMEILGLCFLFLFV